MSVAFVYFIYPLLISHCRLFTSEALQVDDNDSGDLGGCAQEAGSASPTDLDTDAPLEAMRGAEGQNQPQGMHIVNFIALIISVMKLFLKPSVFEQAPVTPLPFPVHLQPASHKVESRPLVLLQRLSLDPLVCRVFYIVTFA